MHATANAEAPVSELLRTREFWTDAWAGRYTPKELRNRRHMFSVDVLMLPTSFCLYYAIGRLLCSEGERVLVASEEHTSPPLLALCAAVLFAATAAGVMYQHVLVAPSPLENDDSFTPQRRLGRWLYLTRQTLNLQMVHALFSLFAMLTQNQGLHAATHAAAVLVAGLGLFVMSQFFVMVVPQPKYKLICKEWAERGVPTRQRDAFLHTPCGVLAVVDLLFVKDRRLLLAATPSIAELVLCYLLYSVFYLALVHVNQWSTGRFPYHFMDELGHSAVKWFKCLAVQFGVLVVFLGWALAVVRFGPTLW